MFAIQASAPIVTRSGRPNPSRPELRTRLLHRGAVVDRTHECPRSTPRRSVRRASCRVMDPRQPFARRDTLCLPRAALLADGLTGRQLAAAVHRGELVRPRRGWYVLPGAPEPLLQAIRVGGRATCITALRSYGIWVPVAERSTGETAHIALPPGASRLRSPRDRCRPLLSGDDREAVLHWRPWDTGHRELWRASLVDALAHAAWCVERDHFAAILESALFEGRLGAQTLRRSRRVRRGGGARPSIGSIRVLSREPRRSCASPSAVPGCLLGRRLRSRAWAVSTSWSATEWSSRLTAAHGTTRPRRDLATTAGISRCTGGASSWFA